MFRFSFATESWTSTMDIKSWKLMPYPKPSESPAGITPASSGIEETGEESMAYFHVDISYPIAARNVPMVRMCLDQGVDVNAKLPAATYNGMTPLIKAVATAYETTRYDTIGTMLLMRRDSRKIVQLLLDHGADKSSEARDLAKNPPDGSHQPDWLIEELLAPFPHPKLHQFISLTDTVWAGEQEKLENMLTQEPGLWNASELQGVSPLGVAVHRNDERMVSMLLSKGASPNARDPMGSSPLAIAVASKLEIIAKLLLQHGASITHVGPVLGLNPIEYAAREGNHTMCGNLLENEKPQSPYDKKELLSKPFALALRQYHTDVIVVLLEHGADVFMDMEPFLRPGERGFIGVSGSHLTPAEFLEGKIYSFADGENPRYVDKDLQELPPTPTRLAKLSSTLSAKLPISLSARSRPMLPMWNPPPAERYQSALRVVLKKYEIQANKKTSQRRDMLSYDRSQSEDLISFE
jgi:ankyrin repeat protein